MRANSHDDLIIRKMCREQSEKKCAVRSGVAKGAELANARLTDTETV